MGSGYPTPGHRNDPHQRGEQEHGGDLEGKEEVGEEQAVERLSARPDRRGRGGRGLERGGPEDEQRLEQEQAGEGHGEPALAAERIGAGLLLARDQYHDRE